ncbi:MAG: hypothetical protein LBP50_07460 [Tannerella sp.]|jgi:hypothetical protein|nr:hypothetical protein [Tannerella sp.]
MRHLLATALFVCLGFPAFSQEKLKAEGEIPIVAWVGVPEAETTLERFLELKESGININYSGYSGIEALEKALDVAQQAGVKVMASCPELKTEPEKTVKRIMHHPALSGYHLRDEPSATDFPELGAWTKRIQAVDAKHYCYINLFPNYAALHQLGMDTRSQYGKGSYAEYVNEFLKEVPVPFISFDHYPVVEENGVLLLRPQWYRNLEEIAAASRKTGLPFWAFALSVAHASYPAPSVGEIKLQMYSNLAYGAQALQYFTYWNPTGDPVYDFNHAPIGLDGKRTDVYDRIQAVNRELQNVAGVFLGAKVVSTGHTGKRIPEGTRRLEKLPEPVRALETGDGGAIVSVLEKGKRRFLVIVNRDCVHPMKLTVVTDHSVKKVLKDGTLVPANAYTPTCEVDPGDAAIFAWDGK